MRLFLLSVVAIAAGVAVAGSAAALTSYSDEATFLAATGASAIVVYPAGSETPLSPGPYVEGGTTISQVADLCYGVEDWTTIIPGNELSVCDHESITVALPFVASSFGFHIDDGFAVGPINGPPADSAFDIVLYAGGSVVGSHFFDPPVDTDTFAGVWSAASFDRVDVIEYQDGIACVETDSCGNENDFFGVFFAGTATPHPVPELPAGLLAAIGLAALPIVLFVSRRSGR